MPNEQKERDEMQRWITRWVTEITLANAGNYLDINKVAEGISRQLLNLIYGYELVDLNQEQSNYPGIDLGDRKAGIAFQVTARTDAKKIRKTLDTCTWHELHKEYTAGVRFLILSEKKVSWPRTGQSASAFDPKRDILYAHDLVDDMLDLYRSDSPRYPLIRALLHREFGNEPRYGGAGSLLEEKDPVIRVVNYIDLFRRMQERETSRFVLIPGEGPVGTLMSDQLPNMIGEGAVVIGPSGCGKSVLIKWLAVTLLDRSVVPLLLEAKYYDSDLNDLVEREVEALGFASAPGFFEDCHEAGRQVLLLLDGLNECTSAKQPKLLAELERVIRRYNANFLITTQTWEHKVSELGGIKIKVDFPSLAIKTAIAGCDNTALEPVLSMVATGLEARIVGEIRTAGTEAFSRFTLFETFARKKLGTVQGMGYALLTRIARFLSDHITFSLSVRRAEGILQDSNIPSEALEGAVRSGLLRRNGNRISFSHEMLLEFFVAGAIVGSLSDPAAITEALSLPKNKGNRLLVLGAIEETGILQAVLESLDDSQLLVAVQQGEAGGAAREWMENRLSQVIRELAEEVEATAFEIVADEWNPVQVKKETLRNRSPQENALLTTLSFLLAKGQYLSDILAVTGVMDNVCDREFRRLREEPREKPVAIRSGIFSALYVGHGRDKAGLTWIFSPLLSGIAAYFSKKEVLAEAITGAAGQEPMSNGQLYLLLLLCRYSEATQGLYPVLMDRLQNHWKYLPRHLRAELIEQAPYACCSQEQRMAMTDVLNAIHTNTRDVLESSNLFEALSALGALDDDAIAHVQTVENQLERLLADPLREEHFGEAASIFYAQFDHPYESAYQTVLEQMPVEKKKLFYTMALKGGDGQLFMISLIFSAARVLEAGVCPFLIRFTQSPVTDEHMPQHSMAVFIYVHLLLAWFRAPLTSRLARESDSRQKTLFACAELYYWLNREDLSPEERRREGAPAAAILFDPKNEFALEGIWQSERAIHTSDYKYYWQGRTIQWPTIEYNKQIAMIARKAIQHPEWAKGIFDHSDEQMAHAIELLKRCGNSSDILLLKQIAAHPNWGSCAVDAIKALEACDKTLW
jgi:energy-coupling factor transporter ATP-binding protein EcfA2